MVKLLYLLVILIKSMVFKVELDSLPNYKLDDVMPTASDTNLV